VNTFKNPGREPGFPFVVMGKMVRLPRRWHGMSDELGKLQCETAVAEGGLIALMACPQLSRPNSRSIGKRSLEVTALAWTPIAFAGVNSCA